MKGFGSVIVRRESMLLTVLAAVAVAGWGQPMEDQRVPQVFVKTGVKWQTPPRSIHTTHRYAQVWLVMMYADGRLAEWGCTLHRERKTNKIWWAYGESQSLSIGTWSKKSQGVISVSTKLVFADVLRCGDPECKTHVYPEHREDWSVTLPRNGVARVIETPRGKLMPIEIDPSEIQTFEKAALAYWGNSSRRF